MLDNSAVFVNAFDKSTVCEKVLDSSYVLLKALPPVCMKYTARDESRVANIA